MELEMTVIWRKGTMRFSYLNRYSLLEIKQHENYNPLNIENDILRCCTPRIRLSSMPQHNQSVRRQPAPITPTNSWLSVAGEPSAMVDHYHSNCSMPTCTVSQRPGVHSPTQEWSLTTCSARILYTKG